ncbi:MAG: PLDc N-terminal domain-containing protein [Jatrophihabitantaceae bacterium]
MLLKLGGLFFLVSLVFWLWAIFDCMTCDTTRVRNLPRWAWAVLILVFLEFGALAWVLGGRPRAGQLVARPNLRQPNRRSRPVGPDDDPDFLRNLRGPDPR